MAFKLPRLLQAVAIVTKEGWPTGSFHTWWQTVVDKIEAQEAAQDLLIAELAVVSGDLTTAEAAIVAAQADADAAQVDADAAQAAADAVAANLVVLGVSPAKLHWYGA